MAASDVFDPEQIPFREVSWGLTKVLAGLDESPGGHHSEQVEFKVTEYAPGYSHHGHLHPGQCELLYVLSGEGVHEDDDGGRQVMRPGDAVWIPPDTWHANHNPHETPLRVLVIKVPPTPPAD